jgi:type IV secretory pathway VirB2 component (pilin)
MEISTATAKARKALTFNPNDKQGNAQAATFLAFLALAFLAVMPEIAMAAPWDSTATRVLEIFTGGMTRTFAIIAVIACGIAAMAGKLSWDWGIKIIVGVVLIFGSASIVDYVIAAAS